MGLEVKSGRDSKALPDVLPVWRHPLPFLYEATGIETHFTNGSNPQARARLLFAFHCADSFAQWLAVTLHVVGYLGRIRLAEPMWFRQFVRTSVSSGYLAKQEVSPFGCQCREFQATASIFAAFRCADANCGGDEAEV